MAYILHAVAHKLQCNARLGAGCGQFIHYNLHGMTRICVQIHTFTRHETNTGSIHYGYSRVKSGFYRLQTAFLTDINHGINGTRLQSVA
jgi:hypothetical protein